MNNNDSPLIPQGSFMEQKNKGRARVRIAVFVVLAIHGIGLMALLMQGCKPNVPPAEPLVVDTNTTVAPFQPTNEVLAPDTNVPPMVVSNPVITPPEPVVIPPTAVPVAPSASEYKIAKGDTFAALAKKFNVSLKSMVDANPGVDPTKLRIGQSIKIPAASTNGSAAAPLTDAASGGQLYTVKSGDSLTKIAGQFGITLKALRAANSLKTDRIRVGQQLKIPPKPVAPPFAAPGTNQ